MDQERIRNMLGSMDPTTLLAYAEMLRSSEESEGRRNSGTTTGTSSSSRLVLDNLSAQQQGAPSPFSSSHHADVANDNAEGDKAAHGQFGGYSYLVTVRCGSHPSRCHFPK